MITLITSVPGSGKTLSIIEMIDSINKEGKRLIYHNIPTLKVHKFTNPQMILDAPDDWRDCDQGSIVIYDECQQPHLYPADAKRGKVEDDRITAMETHRHQGYDLIFITQAVTFIHHHVRKLVGQHIHFYRAMGLEASTRYEWSHTCLDPNDRGEQKRADSKFWKFPKKYYKYYESATLHTHKFKIPTKILLLLIFLVPSIVYVAYLLLNSSFIKDDDEIKTVEQNIVNQTTDLQLSKPTNTRFEWTNNGEIIAVSGCINTMSKCVCYGSNGSPLDMTNGQCLSVVDNPLPFNISFSNHRN